MRLKFQEVLSKAQTCLPIYSLNLLLFALRIAPAVFVYHNFVFVGSEFSASLIILLTESLSLLIILMLFSFRPLQRVSTSIQPLYRPDRVDFVKLVTMALMTVVISNLQLVAMRNFNPTICQVLSHLYLYTVAFRLRPSVGQPRVYLQYTGILVLSIGLIVYVVRPLTFVLKVNNRAVYQDPLLGILCVVLCNVLSVLIQSCDVTFSLQQCRQTQVTYFLLRFVFALVIVYTQHGTLIPSVFDRLYNIETVCLVAVLSVECLLNAFASIAANVYIQMCMIVLALWPTFLVTLQQNWISLHVDVSIAMVLVTVGGCIHIFAYSNRNASDCTTKTSPAILFKGRNLKSPISGVTSTEVIFFRDNGYEPSKGEILNNIGNRMAQIMDLTDASCHRRHLNQIQLHKKIDKVSAPITKDVTNALVPSHLQADENEDIVPLAAFNARSSSEEVSPIHVVESIPDVPETDRDGVFSLRRSQCLRNDSSGTKHSAEKDVVYINSCSINDVVSNNYTY